MLGTVVRAWNASVNKIKTPSFFGTYILVIQIHWGKIIHFWTKAILHPVLIGIEQMTAK